MTSSKTPWTMMAAVVVCAMSVACTASTLEPEDASGRAAGKEGDSTPPPGEGHGMDVEMEYTEEQTEEPQRNRTPPPTRTYSPMNKMD